MSTAHALVTGGRGFIGRHLVEALVRAGHPVTSVDVVPAVGASGARELVLDVGDRRALTALTSAGNFGVVFDLASRTEVGLPAAAYERSVEANASVVAAVEAAAIPKYVLFSTQFVFRRPDVPPRGEEDFAPVDDYGAAKMRSELHVRRALAADRYLILRPTYVWGPGLERFKNGLLYRLARGQLLISAERGLARYYGYVRTVAAQAVALTRLDFAALDRRVFYLTDPAIPLRSFCAALVSALGQGRAVEAPAGLIRALGFAGSVLGRLGLPAPLNALQARELTTRFPVPAAPTIEATGHATDLPRAAAETVAWALSDPVWRARIGR